MTYTAAVVDQLIAKTSQSNTTCDGGWRRLLSDLRRYDAVEINGLGVVRLKDFCLEPPYGDNGYTGDIYIIISITNGEERCFKRAGYYTSFEDNGGDYDRPCVEVKPVPVTRIDWEVL